MQLVEGEAKPLTPQARTHTSLPHGGDLGARRPWDNCATGPCLAFFIFDHSCWEQ